MIHSAQADPRGGAGADAHGKARDQARTARLLLDAELATGTLAPEALMAPAVRRATRVSAVPPRLARVAEQLRYKLGRLDYETAVAEPLLAARRAALGERDAVPAALGERDAVPAALGERDAVPAALGERDAVPAALGERDAVPPRFLVRVDEFPHYMASDDPERFGTTQFERFHEIMAGAGVPYLVAVLPRVAREPLSPTAIGSRPLEPDEVAMLRRLSGDERVAFGLHGRDHRTRFTSPRRHSELCGLSPAATEELLEDGLAELARCEIHPTVFVPPYNRFDAGQFEVLARRFEVVCGGPESIGTMGFHSTPQWRGEAVYLPSYAPVYGRAVDVLPAIERAIERAAGLWVPVVLHWGWEMQAGWGDLERLAERIAPYAAGWEDFHDAIQRSRAPGG